ncbi:ABC transporter substrate-binding protein [Alicyclobacillus fastidiosus]|uniref:ABC transporter substrate-binding protein n=1 Tax=Alicyclobacillus fastidiosus TaxID=392011 RepID=UPI0023E9E7E1|nr:extracellular solute-binding protein [Alicyclobacillus fastidiosus]GMA65980.1 ABC transporter substrate-binding protein [Alicyclobacillus fastidiosus]
MRNSARVALVASALNVATVVSGCGTSNSASDSNVSATNNHSTAKSETGGSASINTDVKTGTNKGTLVLYAAEGYDAAMGAAFEKKTGIKVEVHDDSTGPLITDAESQASNPHWDVIWFDGDSSAQAMDNQGLLLQGWTPNDVNNYTALGQSLIAKDKSYYPTGVTGMGAIGYDPKVTPESDLPKTLNDLLEPQWKNAIAMNDPAISGPTYPLVAGVVQQMASVASGERFFTQLKKNGLYVYDTNSVSINALLTGKVKLAIVQDSALMNDEASGDPIAIDYLQSGTYTLPSVIAIDKQAPDMAAAKEFVEFALSQEGQKVMINPKVAGADAYLTPVIKGVSATPLATSSRKNVNWVRVDPITAAMQKNSLETWFHDNITY